MNVDDELVNQLAALCERLDRIEQRVEHVSAALAAAAGAVTAGVVPEVR